MMATTDTVVDVDKSPDLSADQLEFQDIPHSEDSLDRTPEGKVQTHTFTSFPKPDEDSDEEGDKTDLLKGEKKQPSFWTFEYYQAFFDVDTFQVMRRIMGSAIPNPRTNYLQKQIRPNPDLYGPFWICTTLVFTTAIAGNMANYIQNAGKNYEWRYDFHKVTFAATAIFSYWWLIPTMLWGLLWWRGSQAGYAFMEMICVYGYSLAIYIPISILWVIQVNWLQWLLVMLGMALSGGVLLITFWPAVREDDKKVAWLTMGFILLFHGLLAVGFVLYFFHVPSYSPTEHPVSNITTTVQPSHITTALPTSVTTAVKASLKSAVPGGRGR